MKPCHPVLYLLFFLLLPALSACSGGQTKKPVPDSITSPEKLLNRGTHMYQNNDYMKAINDFEKALLQYRSIDHQTGIAKSMLNIAKSLMAINNNQLASQYLLKAESIINQASLDELKDHLHLLKSSLAINNTLYEQALEELGPLLNSNSTSIKLAALKNRTRIAFLKDTDDKQAWLDKYSSLQKLNPENTASHQANIYRFEAELASDPKHKLELLSQSLAISRELADRPAIAASLTQSAQINFLAEDISDAEDKYLRALFIRHQLGDVKNSMLIMQQLQKIYTVTNSSRLKQTEHWLGKISNNDLSNWDQLFSGFENYPTIK
jgi:tetratricopeptide (TPR) repeat protein